VTHYPGNDVDRLQLMTLTACVLACSDSAACKAVNAIGSAEPRDGLISAIK
jgi:hypothetical protein